LQLTGRNTKSPQPSEAAGFFVDLTSDRSKDGLFSQFSRVRSQVESTFRISVAYLAA